MKKILFIFTLTTLLSFDSLSQTKTQNQSGLSDLDRKKITLVNHLCVLKTMYSYGINSELEITERLKFLSICNQYLEYSNNIFTNDIKPKVTPDVTKKFNSIYKEYSELIEKANNPETSESSARLLLAKGFTDESIVRFVKKLICN